MKIVQLLTAIATTALISAAMAIMLAFGALGLANASYFAVQSDSMAPLMHRGDLVVATPRAFQVGDAVTFRKFDRLVTHRVVAPGKQSGSFETRGDANPSNDPWTITAADVVGVARGVVTNAGWPLLWMTSTLGRILLCLALLSAVAGALWAYPKVLYTQALP